MKPPQNPLNREFVQRCPPSISLGNLSSSKNTREKKDSTRTNRFGSITECKLETLKGLLRHLDASSTTWRSVNKRIYKSTPVKSLNAWANDRVICVFYPTDRMMTHDSLLIGRPLELSCRVEQRIRLTFSTSVSSSTFRCRRLSFFLWYNFIFREVINDSPVIAWARGEDLWMFRRQRNTYGKLIHNFDEVDSDQNAEKIRIRECLFKTNLELNILQNVEK